MDNQWTTFMDSKTGMGISYFEYGIIDWITVVDIYRKKKFIIKLNMVDLKYNKTILLCSGRFFSDWKLDLTDFKWEFLALE
jgi:hypothetical protein